MRIIPLIFLLSLPLAAAAQSYSNAPLLVVKPAQERPNAPPVPATPPAPQAPARPTSPAAPANPIPKLWPRDTIPIFMVSCTKLHAEAVSPCSCIITKVMSQFAHDEFLQLSNSGTIENDPRLIQIRAQCINDVPADKKRPVQGGQR